MMFSNQADWLPKHVFVIAEAGVNHNGDVALARQLIDVAAEAGADAVKFQTFTADRLVTPLASKADYQKNTTGVDETQLEMLKRLELSPEAHRELAAYSVRRGVIFLSSPFDEPCADFLDTLGVPLFKIPSGEITNLAFLSHVAGKGKPMIVSTGMATLGEVEQAVQTIIGAGNQQLTLLHCVSNYPAEPGDVNLCAMQTMASAFGLPVGFSDHTLGIEVALAAVAMGACTIEKHFSLDRKRPGPDHQASLEPAELKALVNGIRKVEVSLGNGQKLPARAELEVAAVARKSLVAARDILVGETFGPDCIVLRRPGTGLPPSLLPHLVGRQARVSIPAGTLITLAFVS